MAGTRAIPSSARVWTARALALAVDGIQIFALPAFFAGAASPVEDAVDVAAGVAFVALLGWHVAFLPSFLAELIPMVDIFPTWTAAVLFVTRGHRQASGA
jgi:hypothetical protein